MNSLFAYPKWEGRCQDAADSDRAREDLVRETIWVASVKGLEVAAVSLP